MSHSLWSSCWGPVSWRLSLAPVSWPALEPAPVSLWPWGWSSLPSSIEQPVVQEDLRGTRSHCLHPAMRDDTELMEHTKQTKRRHLIITTKHFHINRFFWPMVLMRLTYVKFARIYRRYLNGINLNTLISYKHTHTHTSSWASEQITTAKNKDEIVDQEHETLRRQSLY